MSTNTIQPTEIVVERVTEHFALTPRAGVTGGTAAVLADRLTLTHIPTGRAISWSTQFDLHDLAPRLEALPINWSTNTILTRDQIDMVRTVTHETERARAASLPQKLATTPAVESAAPDQPEVVAHIVTRWQRLVGVLMVRAPRTLCGASLELTPDNPHGPRPDSPICPDCRSRDSKPSSAKRWVEPMNPLSEAVK